MEPSNSFNLPPPVPEEQTFAGSSEPDTKPLANRKKMIIVYGLIIVFIIVAIIYARSTLKSLVNKTPASKPNIVFILTDDMDTKLFEYVPNIKSLIANQGTSFNNYFDNISLCCPSRATILRGQYSQNTGISSNGGVDGGYSLFYKNGNEQSTIGTWLHDSGYSTAFIGKYLNGYMKTGESTDDTENNVQPGTDANGTNLPDTHYPPGWDEWFGFDGGAYNGYEYRINHNGKILSKGMQPQDYATDVMASEAQNFLKDKASSNQAFYLAINTFAPHAPYTAAEQDKRSFAGLTYPKNPSFNEADLSDKVDETSGRNQLSAKAKNNFDNIFRKRVESLQAVDRMTAEIVATLTQQGKIDNTYIVFASDNGYHMGEHCLGTGKNTMYDEDIRIPLLIRGPGVPQGKQLTNMIGNVDLAPTFADAAGITAPSFVDGRSILPLFNNQSSTWRNAYPIARGLYPSKKQSDELPFKGIRTERYAYAEFSNGQKQLFDLQNDPYELTNIYNIAPSDLKLKLQVAAENLTTCSGATCRQYDTISLE